VCGVQVIIPVTQWAGSANSCVNPFIYCFFSHKFRAGFKQLFAAAGCRCCCRRRYCASEDGWTRHWDAGGSGAEQTAAGAAAGRREEAAAAEFPGRRGAVRRVTVNRYTTCAAPGPLGIAADDDLTFEATSF